MKCEKCKVDIKPPIGPAYLRWMREAKGLTLRDVEHLTGISNATISQIETGKNKNPSLYIIWKLGLEYGEPDFQKFCENYMMIGYRPTIE